MKKICLYKVIKIDLHIIVFAALCLLSIVVMGTVRTLAVDNTDLSESEMVAVPVVMYHSVTTDYSALGEYVIADYEFNSDCQYLKENGYTPVFVEDLISYTNGGTLPEKPIMLTFDDGYYNNYSSALKIAQEYDFKLIIAIIGSVAEEYEQNGDENPRYAHLSWTNLIKMLDSGLVELQSHTYDMHRLEGRTGVKRKWNESAEEYEKKLSEDLNKSITSMQDNLGISPSAFVYPFGAFSDETLDIVKSAGFKCTFTTTERITKVSRDKDSLYGFGRYVRPSGVGSEDFFKYRMGLGGDK